MKHIRILPAMLRSVMREGLFLIALLAATVIGLPGLGAATITVTNGNDNGPGSLRQALADAVNGDTVNFDSSLNGQLITLTSSQLLVNKSITITGPGREQLWIRRSDALGTPEFRLFYISSGNTVTISGLNMTGGKATSDVGGGIYNDQNNTLTLSNCVMGGNSAAMGGAIFNRNAMLIINDSAIDFNVGDSGGGCIYNSGVSSGNATLTINNSVVSNGWATSGLGGGIYNDGGFSGSATLTIANSIVMSNSAVLGGGIYNDGAVSGNAALTVSNTTFSINNATNNGGGICNDGISGNARLTVTNCTFSGNRATTGGGIYSDGRNVGVATVRIGNTILHVGPAGGGANLFNNSGTVTSLGYNLSSDNSSTYLNATGDQNSTDPLLGPIQDNGGPTLTYELLSGSPAINAGDPNFTPPPDYDQRGPGYPRILNNRVDIGAFEALATPTPTPTPTPTATPRGHVRPHPTPHH